jgi:hypothetical protein
VEETAVADLAASAAADVEGMPLFPFVENLRMFCCRKNDALFFFSFFLFSYEEMMLCFNCV